jgi:GNAT superfamily N-acetyltransferase
MISIKRSSKLNALKTIKVTRPGHFLFRSWARLYRSRFPYQELAPLSLIAKSLQQDESVIVGLVEPVSRQWAGFTLLESYGSSTLLAYLATAPHYEGQGLARKLVDQQLHTHLSKDKPYFWLEASPKLWSFYKKLGFVRLDLDYRIPEFYGSGSEKMGLFVQVFENAELIPKSVVESFISDVLLTGYGLAETDVRYVNQMAVIQRYPHATFSLSKVNHGH